MLWKRCLIGSAGTLISYHWVSPRGFPLSSFFAFFCKLDFQSRGGKKRDINIPPKSFFFNFFPKYTPLVFRTIFGEKMEQLFNHKTDFGS